MRDATRVGLLCAALVLLGGCDAKEADEPAVIAGGLAIHDPYVPAPPADVAALYFRVSNIGAEADRLVRVASPGAARTMLHRTVEEGGRTRMLHVADGIEIPPGAEVALAPGGLHVMLTGLRDPLEEGDHVEVELRFERTGIVTFRAPVVPLADVARDAHGGHEGHTP